MACPTCGAAVRPGAKFCDTCGVELLPSVPRSPASAATPNECPNCKTRNRAEAVFCTNCGVQLKREPLPPVDGPGAFATFAEDYWLVRSILAAIAGFILFLVCLAFDQLVVALMFGLVSAAGVVGTYVLMARHP